MTRPGFESQLANQFRLQNYTISPTVPRHVFKTKVGSDPQRYDELDIFRQQIEESKAGLHHKPYTQNKKSVFIYRCIFLGIAIVFFSLAIAAFSLPSTFHTGLLFGTLTTVKNVVISICFMLSAAALSLGITLQAEKEAVYQCVRRAKAHLERIYGRKSLKLGLKRFINLFGKQRLQTQALRQMYQESLDKINDKKEETLHLVQRIATAETLEAAEKESLLNQAVEELNEKLLILTHTFRHSSIPHFG